MNIAIVDDEELYLNTLKDMLERSVSALGLEGAHIEGYSSANEFLSVMEAGKYDVIILDIYMDGMNGIDLAGKIRALDASVALAFCTSSNEFASQSYELDAKYYLNKPASEEKVASMLKRLDIAKIARNKALRLPDGFRVLLRHILYTEYINHSVKFYIYGQEPHTIYASHGDVEKLLLSHKGFCVINKGCIVNLSQVSKIGANEFLMQNGNVVPIARRRFKEIESTYTKYRFELMESEVDD